MKHTHINILCEQSAVSECYDRWYKYLPLGFKLLRLVQSSKLSKLLHFGNSLHHEQKPTLLDTYSDRICCEGGILYYSTKSVYCQFYLNTQVPCKCKKIPTSPECLWCSLKKWCSNCVKSFDSKNCIPCATFNYFLCTLEIWHVCVGLC